MRYTFAMSEYRRNRVPGGTYFFTVNLQERHQRLLTGCIESLRNAVRKTRLAKPFYIDGWVVLPDHMHCIWTLPEGDADYAARWKAIKIAFSKSLPRTEILAANRLARGERGIWQRRYWEHTIRDERDYVAHMDYIHINPVKHGHATKASDWAFSSFHQMVKAGIYTPDWAVGDNKCLRLANQMMISVDNGAVRLIHPTC
jgi:putative transposase